MTRLPSEDRRRQIADAALKVIAERGLGRFTTASIAAEIGVSDGALFRHFASKDEIVAAALDRAEERLFEGFPPPHADPLARLEAFFRQRAALLAEAPVIARLAFSDELPHAAGPAGAEQVARWRARSLAFLRACLEEAVAGRQAPADLPIGATASLIVGALLALGQLGGPPERAGELWGLVARSWARAETPTRQEAT